MTSRWRWILRLLARRICFRAALFSLLAVALALVAAFIAPVIHYEVSTKIGADGKGERVFHCDPEITHRILDLAMAEQDLNGAKVASGPVDNRCLRSAK